MSMTSSRSGSRSSSATKTYLLRTQGFLRNQLWIWPLLAAAVLAFVGLWLRGQMERTMKQQTAASLQTILTANTEALREWSKMVKAEAENLAEDARVRELVLGLQQQLKPGVSPQAALLTAPQLTALRNHLTPMLARQGFNGFVVLDTNTLIIASGGDQLLGFQSPPNYQEQFAQVFAGQSLVTHPFPSVAMLTDAQGHLRAGVPTMFAVAPIRDANGQIIAALGLRIVPETDFTRILAQARSGQTGETYAFSRTGILLSESRFDDDLKRLGLIPDTEDSRSILTLELRDPLVDLDKGRPAPKRRTELPFIHAVSEGLAGRSGEDVTGYRNYRGITVVGAWKWLPEFDLGLVTEMDVAEGMRPLRVLRIGFWFIFGLLTLGAVLVFVLMRLSARLQAAARKSALKAKQLGQYALDDKIGAGAFGAVYRAHHALMRRPVAVKLLEMETKDDNTIARFEREVQLTSQLTHPNTIALYDFGRTPEGVFYYAMEYLEGLTLDGLVKKYGAQSEGRVIFILRQICGSLAEAHDIGLVHRDIKPANIFLTRRGGVPDFVKVLDFGLVKANDSRDQLELTAASTTLGTPLYMSPEAVERPNNVDARSDLYSLGAVGYFLLTGEPLFQCLSLGEVLMHQVKAAPDKPSARLRKPVATDLEDLILRCLAKDPAERPATARTLEMALSRCQNANDWTREKAEAWWQQRAAVNSNKTMVMPPVH
jgi:hypothetical protein